MYEEKFYQLHAAQLQLLRPQSNLGKNGSFSYRENLHYKITARRLGFIESVHENL